MRTLLLAAGLAAPLCAQGTPTNGPRAVDPGWHAIVHATLIPRPGEKIANATVVIRDGRIAAVGQGLAAPAGARVWEADGLFVHAGFLDGHVPVETPKPDRQAADTHWNARVLPNRDVLSGPGPDAKLRSDLRRLGFTAAALAPKDGIFRGTGAIVALVEPDEVTGRRFVPLRERAFQALALEFGGEYPNSLMGAIAVVRQTLHDAAADLPQARALRGNTRFLGDVSDELDALRLAKIAREFNRPCVLVGSGFEFRRLQAIREDGCPLVVPVAFPDAPDVQSIAEAEWTSLRELMTWEQAPTNPRRLAAGGNLLAWTSDRLKSRSEFWRNLRKAVQHGLPEARALAMLTIEAARIFGVDAEFGTVEAGKRAHLVVCDGPLFAESTRIRDVWVEGRRFAIEPAPEMALAGRWQASFAAPLARDATLTIDRAHAVTLVVGDKKASARNAKTTGTRLDFLVDGEVFASEGVYALQVTPEREQLFGRGVTPNGQLFTWTAQRLAPAEPESRPDRGKEAVALPPEELTLPFGPYGLTAIPPQEDLVLDHVTLWTCAGAGIVADGALVIEKGKIVYAGPAKDAPRPPGVRVVDAAGKHVTPGLIDCHSHTGISKGLNEGGQAVTAEVRIADVVDPDAVGFYRELAGGVTTVNQLHGSANPIGGQNHVVKLRWGVTRPEQMHLDGAPAGIKFALGENVKGGTQGGTRYPQTRMGVEALLRDRFHAAREYSRTERVDLELEALQEVLQGKRLVHCHSYRQDEILMLCRVARDFGFKIGTFQHVLEGYKVADAIREHAIGASSFSDWWAYKVEAYDAIPYNGALMHAKGVNVSFNSDSDQVARHLNTEASKAVRYGGVPPAEALGFVSRNAAIQLGIDGSVGALEAGKDADFAIWSGDPLSTYTRCLATWIDGREYFSIGRDAALRSRIDSEKRRLVQKVLKAPKEQRAPGADSKPEQRPSWFDRVVRRGECVCGEEDR